MFVVSGLTAGIAAFLGASFYGSASCGDATGYELYVIASAVVGGASLSGGKGSAVSAMLGALLIVLIRQSIRTLHFDQNYEWIIIGCAIIVAVVARPGEARALAARRLVARTTGGDSRMTGASTCRALDPGRLDRRPRGLRPAPCPRPRRRRRKQSPAAGTPAGGEARSRSR